MQELMTPREKHTKFIYQLVVLFVVLSAAGTFMIGYGIRNTNKPKSVPAPTPQLAETAETQVVDTPVVEETTNTVENSEMPSMPEEENTPVEIDNDVVKELDSILDYIDNTSMSDDLSDLEM